MQRSLLVPALSLVLALPALTSCSLLGGSSHLEDALDLVPDGASQVVFRDREAIAERLDLDGVGADASADELQRYVDTMSADAAGPDELTGLVATAEDARFGELDVTWSVSGVVEQGGFSAYRVADDVDLDEVADDLAGAGYAEDELRGRRHLVLAAGNGEPSGDYPTSWIEVTVDPDEHLVISGAAEGLLRVLDDDSASLRDNDTLQTLLDDTDDVHYAVVSDPAACDIGARTPPAALDASGIGVLGSPERTALLVSGDDAEVAARLEFADDDAAEDDLGARRTYLDEGTLASTREPVSSLGSFDLERVDAVVRVAVDLERPADAAGIAARGDGFLACNPGIDDDGTTPSAPSTPSAPATSGPADPTVTAPTDDATVELP